MKGKTISIYILAILLIFLACSPMDKDLENPSPPGENNEELEEKDPIEEKIENMSLEEKLGQLVMIGLEGEVIDQNTIDHIRDNKVGGFIFFNRNIKDKDQVIKLIDDMKEENRDNKIPLFFAIDEEGGLVSRLSNVFKNLPDVAVLGERDDMDLSYDYGQIQGSKLRNLGFNINFAPVLDVNSNPANPVIGRRAIGNDPEIVSRHGIEIIKGIGSQQIISVAKHFPGHGDTSVDSHLDLPLVEKTMEELNSLEFIPFKSAIENNIDMLMIAHILYSNIDGENPATMSASIINEILRQQFDYDGIVISDDMTMGAITKNYKLEEASLKFLQSGGDIVLVCHGVENPDKVLDRLEESVHNGELSIDEIDAKLYRILKLKGKYKLEDLENSEEEIRDINKRVDEFINNL